MSVKTPAQYEAELKAARAEIRKLTDQLRQARVDGAVALRALVVLADMLGVEPGFKRDLLIAAAISQAHREITTPTEKG